ncbi:MAG: T9SS type A sorting domain-containing protein [Bacteroidetes bacterium]|nr:T9SS type A sorting domain-containing protein [Bacteroidota bacterium]
MSKSISFVLWLLFFQITVFAQIDRTFPDATRQEINGGEKYTRFGTASAISGSDLFISNNNYYIAPILHYRKVSGSWNLFDTIFSPQSSGYENFGYYMSCFGDQLLVSQINPNLVFLFERNPSTNKWEHTETFTESNSSKYKNFGSKVLIKGKYIFISSSVGETEPGYLHVYENQNGVWSLKQIIESPSHSNGTFARAFDCNSKYLFITQPEYSNFYQGIGKVYQYSLINNLWNLTDSIPNPTPASHENFGQSIAVNNDFLVIGADSSSKYGANRGKVCYYTFNQNKTEYVGDIHQTGFAFAYLFGNNLALSDDLVAIYSAKSTTKFGDVKMYELNGSGATLIRTFLMPSNSSEGFFGQSIAFNGADICIGAPEFDFGGVINTGVAYTWKSEAIHAAKQESDGFIDLEWAVPVKCAHSLKNPEIYFQLMDNTNQKEIKLSSNHIDSINNYDIIKGTLRHPVKPDSTLHYSINIYEVGQGTKVCPEWQDSGSTKPFITPHISATNNFIDRIELSMFTYSDFGSKYRLYRNNKLIATLDTNTRQYDQVVNIRDTNAIENGKTYSYSLESINSDYGDISSRSYVAGSTVAINFSSSGNEYPDKIQLSWANLSAYADYFVIERDGKTLGAPLSDDTTFVDEYPIPGYTHTYALKIYKNSNLVTFQELEAGVDANGEISGWILNKNGGFGVPNTRVIISASIEGVKHEDTTITDGTGAYQFTEVYYHQAADFTITAGNGDVNFTKNNIAQKLTLTDHIKRLDFETIINADRDKSRPVSVSKLKSKPLTTEDEMQLNWKYTFSDQIYFKILRNGKLQDIFRLNSGDSTHWEDATGFPKEKYTYTVVAYNRWLYRGDWKYDTMRVSVSDTFPNLANPRFFDVTPRPNWSTVHMTWDVTSDHNKTVEILRNGKVIGTSDEPRFTDYTGKAGTSYTYAIRSKSSRLHNNQSDFSKQVGDTTVTYPALRTPTNVKVLNTNDRLPIVSWKFDECTDYNYTGFKIIRNGAGIDTIGTIYSDVPMSLIDYTAQPGISYDYSVLSFKDELFSRSNATSAVSHSTQALLSPSNVTASNDIEGLIQINWSTNNSGRIDGYRLIIEKDTLWAKASESQLVYQTGNDKTLSIDVYSYRLINGTKRYSTKSHTEGKALQNINGNLTAVTNLTASMNLNNAVKIKWEYPEYILSIFHVTRNGVEIATLKENETIYYDYDVAGEPTGEYVYGVYATNSNKISSVKYAYGAVAPSKRIDGFTINKYSKFGIENAEVTLIVESPEDNSDSKAIGIYRTVTDSTGYFSFTEFDFSGSDKYRITAKKDNHIFAPDTTNFNVDRGNPYTSLTIVDQVKRSSGKEDNKISTAVQFSGEGMTSHNSVMLHWSMNGANFSRVEVYRGVNKLQTINRGENMSFIDDEGAPGYQFVYRIKSVWDKDPITTLQSGYDTILINYPMLKWVEYLTATKRNDHIRLNWTHEGSVNCSYLVMRGNDTLGIVPQGEKLMFIDSTGQPGRGYVYSVKAILIRNIGTFLSIATTVDVVYPKISEVAELTPSTDRNTVKLSWKPASDYIHKYRIYRNGKVIATLPDSGESSFSFNDFNGFPLNKEEYAVTAVSIRNGFEYESRKTSLTQEFPVVYPLDTFRATVVADSNYIRLNWNWKNKLDSGYTTFHIYATNINTGHKDTIATLDRSVYSFIYDAGLPENNYRFEIRASDNRDGKYAESDVTASVTTIFPKLSAPNQLLLNGTDSLLAINNETGNILSITWNYNSINHSGFIIRKSGNIIDTLSPTIRQLALPDLKVDCPDTTTKISVQSFLKVNGTYYFSDLTVSSILPIDYSQGLYECSNPEDAKMGAADIALSDSFLAFTNGKNYDVPVTMFRQYNNRWVNDHRLKFPQTLSVSDMASAPQIAITDEHLAVSFPSYDGKSGIIFMYHRENGNWKYIQTIKEPGGVNKNSNFAAVIEVRGNRMVASNFNSGTDQRGKIYIYIYNGSQWSLNANITGDGKYRETGWDLAINDEYCVALSSNKVNYQYIEIYKWNGSTYSLVQSIPQTAAGLSSLYLTDSNQFFYKNYANKTLHGWRYDNTNNVFNQYIYDIYYVSTFDDLAIDEKSGTIAAGFNIGTSNAKIEIFKLNVANNYQYKTNYFSWQSESEDPTDKFGQRTVICGNKVVTCAPNQSVNSVSASGKGYSMQFVNGNWITDKIDNNPVTNLNATKGTNGVNTLLTWSYSGNKANNNGFNIYRDTTQIAFVAADAKRYFDISGIPGKHYEYEIRADDSSTKRYRRSVDIGWKQADGRITGKVLNITGASGVPGVSVEAKAFLDGEYRVYKTVTNANGEYTLYNVYYGDFAEYVVTVNLEGHLFDKSTQTITVEPKFPNGQLEPFLDKTAYILSGIVSKENSCPLDSMLVELKVKRFDGSVISKTSITDNQGKYSFTLEPYDPTISSFEVYVSDTQSTKNSADTTWHRFISVGSAIFSDMESIQFENKLDIIDTLGYYVDLDVRNACKIISGYAFEIEINSKGAGCYNRHIYTNVSGIAHFKLPPDDVYSFRVVNSSPLNAKIRPITDYLSSRFLDLDLSVDHNKDLNKLAYSKQLENQKLSIVYHAQPKITIQGIHDFVCNDPSKSALITQNNTETYKFEVFEIHDGQQCPVTEGSLVIRNGAATSPNTTIEFSDSLQGFDYYQFTVSDPIVIPPFQHYLNVEYHTPADGYMSKTQQSMVVLGSKAQPGSDFIIDLGEGGWQWPLHILRDPPGDGSYSYIEKGESFSRSISIEDESNSYLGGITENTINIGTGFFLEGEIKKTFGGGNAAAFEVNFETNQRIQTTDNSNTDNADGSGFMVGEEGDVLVGIGLTMKYGTSDQIFYSEESCQVLKSTALAISPSDVKTTWAYTLSQIKRLIQEYKQDSASALSGEKTVTFADSELTPEEGADYYHRIIMNWEEVLKYHRINTVPFVQLCDPSQDYNVKEPFKSQLGEWRRNGFCKSIGRYDKTTGEFSLNQPIDSIVWTQEMINNYNAVSQVVRDLKNSDYQLNKPSGYSFSESRLKNVKIDQEYNSQYGADAERLAFSGGVIIEKSVGVSQSKSREFKQFSSFDVDAKFGVTYGGELKLGLGVGSIVIKDVSKITGKSGFQVGYTHTYNSSEGNTIGKSNTTGYVLTDDDIGDQFNTFVFRGIDPAHTPYFTRPIGRSSCPYEPGTQPRDLPLISVEDYVARDQDPNSVVVFPLTLGNAASSEYLDWRYYEIGIAAGANSNGATLTADGVGQYYPYTVGIPPGQTVKQLFNVGIGPIAYDYPDLTLVMIPSCSESAYTTTGNGTEQNFEVYFKNPCSQLSLSEPGDNWVINRANPLDTADREFVTIVMSDYDLDIPSLIGIDLEYRRIGGGQYDWKTIVSLSPNFLQEYYDSLSTSYPVPTFVYDWDITGNDEILDGTYEIRGRLECSASGVDVLSNVFKGIINRQVVGLFGTPEPKDGLLSLGDEVSVQFSSEDFYCPTFTDTSYAFYNKANLAPIQFTHECRQSESKVIFKPVDAIADLDGIEVLAQVNEAYDIYGNNLGDTIFWEFEISNNPVYWHPDSVVVDIYRGDKTEFIASLINTFGASESFTISGQSEPWLQLPVTSGTVAPYNLKELTLKIDATALTDSVYHDTLYASFGAKPYSVLVLPIVVNVYPTPVKWVVNRSNYETEATVICNYAIDKSETATATVIDQYLSSNKLDKIAVFINGELRGTANITEFGNKYRAYITVSGNYGETGKMKFYVWDATTGIQYEGHPRSMFTFQPDGQYGSTNKPVVLDVNSKSDSVRFVPLKKGWNWLAFNTTQSDMSVNSVLSTLKPGNGIILKTLDESSFYDVDAGWVIMSNGTDKIDVREGYLLKLPADDTLKVVGNYLTDTLLEISLDSGWNIIGNPYRNNVAIDLAINGTGLSDGALIKNDLQTGDFDSAAASWNGITTLMVNKSYMLKNGKVDKFKYQLNKAGSSCDNLNPKAFDRSHNFLAAVRLNGTEQRNAFYKVRAYVGDECRGQGKLEYVSKLDRYLMNLFVYGEKEGEIIHFVIEDNLGTLYPVPDSVYFETNRVMGSPATPYVFSNLNDVVSIPNISKVVQGIQLAVYPNPSDGNATIKFSCEDGGLSTIEIMDLNGRNILSMEINAVPGINEIPLNVHEVVQSGVYLVRLSKNGATNTVRMAITK